jgi:hypothetical protein
MIILSRRRLLAIALAVGDARARAPPARAQTPPRMSQAAAQYQNSPRGGLSCIGCTFFQRPRSCKVVEGDISPNGWCRLFDLPD